METEPEVLPAAPEPAAPALQDEFWTLDTMWRTAQRIANTAIVPSAIRGKPDAVIAVMLTGREIGLEPMASLAAIAFIQGKPSLNALGMRAVVVGRGHQIETLEADANHAVVFGRRADTKQEEKVTWTIAEAEAAGLLQGEDGPRLNWKRWPADMNVARATARLCRRLFSDCILGVAYLPEELEEVNDAS